MLHIEAKNTILWLKKKIYTQEYFIPQLCIQGTTEKYPGPAE